MKKTTQNKKQPKNTLRITVSGAAGSGKSSVAWLIKNALETRGFAAEFIDDDHPEAFFHVEKRLDALVRANGTVLVTTHRVPRSGSSIP